MNWYWRTLLLGMTASAVWLGISGYRLAKVLRERERLERVFYSDGTPSGLCEPDDMAVNTKSGAIYYCTGTQEWKRAAPPVAPGAPTITVQ